jgi:hypothetical protein
VSTYSLHDYQPAAPVSLSIPWIVKAICDVKSAMSYLRGVGLRAVNFIQFSGLD